MERIYLGVRSWPSRRKANPLPMRKKPENAQNVLLVLIIAVGVAGLRRKERTWERVSLLVLIGVTLFLLLEETDYGFQYVTDEPVNIHETGGIEATLEHLARFGGLVFFGGFAILFADSKNPLLRYLAPSRWSVLTILLVTALWEVAVRIPDDGGPLDGHALEFAELGIYYIVLVYVWEMVFRRQYEPSQT